MAADREALQRELALLIELEDLEAQEAADGQAMPAVDEGQSALKTGAEVGTAVVTGLVGQIAGGLTGIGTALQQAKQGFLDINPIAENIKTVQEFITVEPTSKQGQETLQVVGEKLEEVKRLIEAGVAGTGELVAGRGISTAAKTITDIRERGAGEVVLERTDSPELATLADLGVDLALLTAQGTGVLRGKGATPKPPGVKAPVAAEVTPSRVKLAGAEKDVVRTLELDSSPNRVNPFRVAKTRRQSQIDALEEAKLTATQLGEQAKIADVGGANTRALAQVQGAVSREGQFLRRDMIKRDAGVRDRMIEVLDKTLFKGRTAKKIKQDVETKSAASAEDAYNRAYLSPVELTPELSKFLARDFTGKRKIFRDAEDLIRSKSETKLTVDQRNLGLSMFDNGELVFQNINMVGLDHIKRALRQKAGGTKIKKGELSVSFKDASQELRDILVKINSDYAEALSIWAGRESALAAGELGRDAAKLSINNKVGLEQVIDDFGKLNPAEQTYFKVSYGETLRNELRRRPNSKSGQTPPSVFSAFAGNPAQQQLLRIIFDSSEDFRLFDRLIQREGVFSDTVKAVNIDDARELALQQSFSLGELPEAIAGIGTDALFVKSGNRFAALRLIQQAFTAPKQLIARLRASKTAKQILGVEAKAAIQEMIDVLKAQNARPGISQKAIKIPKDILNAARMPADKLIDWLSVEKNRRALYAFGTMAVVVEEANEEEPQEDRFRLKQGSENVGVTEQLNLGTQ